MRSIPPLPQKSGSKRGAASARSRHSLDCASGSVSKRRVSSGVNGGTVILRRPTK
jgi:hypothetical protein